MMNKTHDLSTTEQENIISSIAIRAGLRQLQEDPTEHAHARPAVVAERLVRTCRPTARPLLG